MQSEQAGGRTLTARSVRAKTSAARGSVIVVLVAAARGGSACVRHLECEDTPAAAGASCVDRDRTRRSALHMACVFAGKLAVGLRLSSNK